MDLKDAENQIDKADSLLDKLWKFLGKHWGKLIILLLIYGGYKFCMIVAEEMDKPQVEQAQPIDSPVTSDPVMTDRYYDIDVNGDSIVIRTWSDGIIDTVLVE